MGSVCSLQGFVNLIYIRIFWVSPGSSFLFDFSMIIKIEDRPPNSSPWQIKFLVQFIFISLSNMFSMCILCNISDCYMCSDITTGVMQVNAYLLCIHCWCTFIYIFMPMHACSLKCLPLFKSWLTQGAVVDWICVYHSVVGLQLVQGFIVIWTLQSWVQRWRKTVKMLSSV